MAESINTEKSLLIWFDDAGAYSQEDELLREHLRTMHSNFQFIKSRALFDEYFKSQAPNARVTLIVSGRLGQQLVPNIQSLTQISAIYVYCMDKAMHQKWAINYSIVLI